MMPGLFHENQLVVSIKEIYHGVSGYRYSKCFEEALLCSLLIHHVMENRFMIQL